MGAEVWFLLKRRCDFAWFRAWFHLVPLGSMKHWMYYVQHSGLVPARFRLVPLVEGLFFAARGLGSMKHWMYYLQHSGFSSRLYRSNRTYGKQK